MREYRWHSFDENLCLCSCIDRLIDGWMDLPSSRPSKFQKEQTFQDLQSLHQVCSVFSLIEYKRRKWSHHTPPPLIILGFRWNGLVIWVSQIIRVGLFGSEQFQTETLEISVQLFEMGTFRAWAVLTRKPRQDEGRDVQLFV